MNTTIYQNDIDSLACNKTVLLLATGINISKRSLSIFFFFLYILSGEGGIQTLNVIKNTRKYHLI